MFWYQNIMVFLKGWLNHEHILNTLKLAKIGRYILKKSVSKLMEIFSKHVSKILSRKYGTLSLRVLRTISGFDHDELLAYFTVRTRGKKILQQLLKPRFLRSSKIAGFLPLLRSREEKGAIFKLCKKPWLWELFLYRFPSNKAFIVLITSKKALEHCFSSFR